MTHGTRPGTVVPAIATLRDGDVRLKGRHIRLTHGRTEGGDSLGCRRTPDWMGGAVATEPTAIDGLLVVRWETHGDDRGFFRQTHQVQELAEALGRTPRLRQGNHARSAPGVLRGFHAEPWDKLVYVVRGRAMGAWVDIRPDSPTFGQVVTAHLGDPGGPHDADRIRVFVPEGVANAYCTYGDDPVDYLYDVSDYWRAGVDKSSVAWDDPDLAVDWPLPDPVLSEADRANPTLRERFPRHPRWE